MSCSTYIVKVLSAVNGAAKLDAFQLVMSYDVQVGRELGNKFEITSSNPEKLVSTTRKCSPSEVAYSTGILRVRVLENWNYMYYGG